MMAGAEEKCISIQLQLMGSDDRPGVTRASCSEKSHGGERQILRLFIAFCQQPRLYIILYVTWFGGEIAVPSLGRTPVERQPEERDSRLARRDGVGGGERLRAVGAVQASARGLLEESRRCVGGGERAAVRARVHGVDDLDASRVEARDPLPGFALDERSLSIREYEHAHASRRYSRSDARADDARIA